MSGKAVCPRVPPLDCDTIGIELAEDETDWLEETSKVENKESEKIFE